MPRAPLSDPHDAHLQHHSCMSGALLPPARAHPPHSTSSMRRRSLITVCWHPMPTDIRAQLGRRARGGGWGAGMKDCLTRGETAGPEHPHLRRRLWVGRSQMAGRGYALDRALIQRVCMATATEMARRRIPCRVLGAPTQETRGRGYAGCCRRRITRLGCGASLMVGSRRR